MYPIIIIPRKQHLIYRFVVFCRVPCFQKNNLKEFIAGIFKIRLLRLDFLLLLCGRFVLIGQLFVECIIDI